MAPTFWVGSMSYALKSANLITSCFQTKPSVWREVPYPYTIGQGGLECMALPDATDHMDGSRNASHM